MSNILNSRSHIRLAQLFHPAFLLNHSNEPVTLLQTKYKKFIKILPFFFSFLAFCSTDTNKRALSFRMISYGPTLKRLHFRGLFSCVFLHWRIFQVRTPGYTSNSQWTKQTKSKRWLQCRTGVKWEETWRRSGMQTEMGRSDGIRRNGSLLTWRTLFVRPVFWASCFKSFASGLWLMAK